MARHFTYKAKDRGFESTSSWIKIKTQPKVDTGTVQGSKGNQCDVDIIHCDIYKYILASYA